MNGWEVVCEAITKREKSVSKIRLDSVLSSIKHTLNHKISIKKDIQYFALSFI